jgi:hypothetical protein
LTAAIFFGILSRLEQLIQYIDKQFVFCNDDIDIQAKRHIVLPHLTVNIENVAAPYASKRHSYAKQLATDSAFSFHSAVHDFFSPR